MELRTERLILREFVEGDHAAVHAYAGDPDVTRFMPWGPKSEEDTRAFLERTVARQREEPRRTYDLAIVLRDEGRLVGGCSINLDEPGKRSGWIGYVLHRDWWGRGIMPAAAGALLRFGFEVLGFHRIWATCDVLNARSARVLEKTGMGREGLMREDTWMRDRWRSTCLYAVLEHEWRDARDSA